MTDNGSAPRGVTPFPAQRRLIRVSVTPGTDEDDGKGAPAAARGGSGRVSCLIGPEEDGADAGDNNPWGLVAERAIAGLVFCGALWSCIHTMVVYSRGVYEPVLYGYSMTAMALSLGFFLTSSNDEGNFKLARCLTVAFYGLGMPCIIIELVELNLDQNLNTYVTGGVPVPGFRTVAFAGQGQEHARAALQSRFGLMIYLSVVGSLAVLYCAFQFVCSYCWNKETYAAYFPAIHWGRPLFYCADSAIETGAKYMILHWIQFAVALLAVLFMLADSILFLENHGQFGKLSFWGVADTHYLALCMLVAQKLCSRPYSNSGVVAVVAVFVLLCLAAASHMMMFQRIVEFGSLQPGGADAKFCFLSASCVAGAGALPDIKYRADTEYTHAGPMADGGTRTVVHYNIEMAIVVLGGAFYLARLVECLAQVVRMCGGDGTKGR